MIQRTFCRIMIDLYAPFVSCCFTDHCGEIIRDPQIGLRTRFSSFKPVTFPCTVLALHCTGKFVISAGTSVPVVFFIPVGFLIPLGFVLSGRQDSLYPQDSLYLQNSSYPRDSLWIGHIGKVRFNARARYISTGFAVFRDSL